MLKAIHFKLLGLSVALLVVGFILLAQGPVDNPVSKTVAPVVLVLVYCGLIPYAIMAREKKDGDEKDPGV